MSNHGIALRSLALAFLAVTTPSSGADIVLTPPVGGGVAVTDSGGTTNRFRVADDGSITLPGVAAVPGTFTGLCAEIATGKVGTCAPSAGTVTSVGAVSPLGSSGGTTPSISITGTIPVTSGGTGRSSFTDNGILFGQGAGIVANTIAATPGAVLIGTIGVPTFTGSPSLSGSLTLAGPLDITAGFIDLPTTTSVSQGYISKGGTLFLHNYYAGSNNTFLGISAGNLTLTGFSNTGAGAFALNGLTTGTRNTAVGLSALGAATTAGFNTAVGDNALGSNTASTANTAVGYRALASSTLGSNTAVGYQALDSNTTGTSNTALGSGALGGNTTGGVNIGLGANAGSQYTTGTLNIAIGNAGFAAESFTIRIGTLGSQTRAFIAGITGVTTAGAAVPVLVDGSGQLGVTDSSRRVKDRIADMDAASEALMRLRPVTFHYTSHGPDGPLQYGLVAEEVAEVYPDLVMHGADGKIQTVMYQYLPPMLLNEYQKLQRRAEAQEAQIARLERRLASMADALRKLTGDERQ